MNRIIRIGSRESALAMTQSNWVVEELRKHHPQLEFEIVGIKTKGDIILDKRLDKIGGKGLFIKELENALLDKSIDMAVHSMKDIPAEIPEGLAISAVSKREDPRDVLVTKDGRTLEQLPMGAVIGTSSIRREVQLLLKRPDLQVKTLRGNVLTRLDKLLRDEYDALVLAAAGLIRLGLQERCVQYFDVDTMIPAVGQGILAIETREDDTLSSMVKAIHCTEASIALSAERAYMVRLNGGCSTPIAAHATVHWTVLKVSGMLASEDKTTFCRDYIEGSIHEAAELGEKLAQRVLERFEKMKNGGYMGEEYDG